MRLKLQLRVVYKQVVDAASGQPYFYNTYTHASSWTAPVFLGQNEPFTVLPAHVDPAEKLEAVKALASGWQTFETEEGWVLCCFYSYSLSSGCN